MTDFLVEETGEKSLTAVEAKIFKQGAASAAELSNILSKVRRAERSLPLGKLKTLENAVPGTKKVYCRPLWELMSNDEIWSTSRVLECMKRLPDELTERLFLPKSKFRHGAFERRHKTVHEKVYATTLTNDAFDGLTLHLAFFREAEISGDVEECFLWSRQIDSYMNRTVLPIISTELGKRLLEALRLGIKETVEVIATGAYADRDDLLDLDLFAEPLDEG